MGGDYNIGERRHQSQWRRTLIGRDKILARGCLSKFWLMKGYLPRVDTQCKSDTQ